MKREEFIKTVSSKLKLIRTEYGITQEAMSEMLGISKKTLVETEKGLSPWHLFSRRAKCFRE